MNVEEEEVEEVEEEGTEKEEIEGRCVCEGRRRASPTWPLHPSAADTSTIPPSV